MQLCRKALLTVTALAMLTYYTACTPTPSAPQPSPEQPPVIEYPTQTPKQLFEINNLTFHDYNGDGIQENGEPSLEGIKLIYNPGNIVGVTDKDGKSTVKVPAGNYTISVSDSSGKYRYILPSISEVMPIENGLKISIDKQKDVLIPVAEGFLTIPFTKDTRITKQYSYFDLDPGPGYVKDWRSPESVQGINNGITMDGHIGTDWGLNEGTSIIATAPGIISSIQDGWPNNPEIQGQGNTLFIYHNNQFWLIYLTKVLPVVE